MYRFEYALRRLAELDAQLLNAAMSHHSTGDAMSRHELSVAASWARCSPQAGASSGGHGDSPLFAEHLCAQPCPSATTNSLAVARQIKYQTYLGLSRCERKRKVSLSAVVVVVVFVYVCTCAAY